MDQTILTTVSDTRMGKDIVVGWDVCGKCNTFVTRCACPAGPTPPKYVTQWNGPPPPAYESREPKPEGYVMPEYQRPNRRADGRKIRSDKGVKRKADFPRSETGSSLESDVPAAQAENVLTGPCALHTAESAMLSDSTYRCTVPGCPGVA